MANSNVASPEPTTNGAPTLATPTNKASKYAPGHVSYNIVVIRRSHQIIKTSTARFSQHQHGLQHPRHRYYNTTTKRQHHQQPSRHQCCLLQCHQHRPIAAAVSKSPTLASPWGYLGRQPWPPPPRCNRQHQAGSNTSKTKNGHFNINLNHDATRTL